MCMSLLWQYPLSPPVVYPQANATCASNPTCASYGLKVGSALSGKPGALDCPQAVSPTRKINIHTFPPARGCQHVKYCTLCSCMCIKYYCSYTACGSLTKQPCICVHCRALASAHELAQPLAFETNMCASVCVCAAYRATAVLMTKECTTHVSLNQHC